MTPPPLFGPNFPTSIEDPEEDQVEVFWYHPNFTQSRYPPGQEASEACTLICLLVAQRIAETGLQITSLRNCPKFNILMAEAIIEGNTKHAWIMRNGLIPHPYLNTDEALKYGGRSLNTMKEWKFHVYNECIENSLNRNIVSFLREWYQRPKADTLFMLLITCGRTVLFIFQEQTCKVTLFDSHGHVTPRKVIRGLVLAQTSIGKLQHLCDWYVDVVLYNCFNAQADQYELAFLYRDNAILTNCRRISCDCGCLDR